MSNFCYFSFLWKVTEMGLDCPILYLPIRLQLAISVLHVELISVSFKVGLNADVTVSSTIFFVLSYVSHASSGWPLIRTLFSNCSFSSLTSLSFISHCLFLEVCFCQLRFLFYVHCYQFSRRGVSYIVCVFLLIPLVW